MKLLLYPLLTLNINQPVPDFYLGMISVEKFAGWNIVEIMIDVVVSYQQRVCHNYTLDNLGGEFPAVILTDGEGGIFGKKIAIKLRLILQQFL